MNKRINLRLSDATHRALAELAKKREVPLAQIIRDALRAYLFQKKAA